MRQTNLSSSVILGHRPEDPGAAHANGGDNRC